MREKTFEQEIYECRDCEVPELCDKHKKYKKIFMGVE